MDETDELGGFQFLELRSTLPDELLMYADKLSMAHSLEVRVPFLDKEIVEYAERLPSNLKVRNGSGKWLHRQVCQELLPAAILKRKKRGFGVNVVDDWFRGVGATENGRNSAGSGKPDIQLPAPVRSEANLTTNIAPDKTTTIKSFSAWWFSKNGCGRMRNP